MSSARQPRNGQTPRTRTSAALSAAQGCKNSCLARIPVTSGQQRLIYTTLSRQHRGAFVSPLLLFLRTSSPRSPAPEPLTLSTLLSQKKAFVWSSPAALIAREAPWVFFFFFAHLFASFGSECSVTEIPPVSLCCSFKGRMFTFVFGLSTPEYVQPVFGTLM